MNHFGNKYNDNRGRDQNWEYSENLKDQYTEIRHSRSHRSYERCLARIKRARIREQTKKEVEGE